MSGSKKIWPKLFVLLLTLSAAFFIGYRMGNSSRSQMGDPIGSNSNLTEVARQKLQNLSDVEIAEYFQLKTMEEKYRKADEILGKIVAIFLADLGLHVSDRTAKQARDVLAGNYTIPITEKSIPPTVKSQEPLSRAKLQHANLLEAERKLQSGIADRDVDDFLKSVKLDDIIPEARNSSSFSFANPPPEALFGHYQGQTTLQDGTHRIWDIVMDVSGGVKEDHIEGTERITLSENGKIFSNKSGDGDIKDFKRSLGGSDAILIEASPSTYFQLYYLKNQDEFIGNLYQQSSGANPFIFKGSFTLRH